MTCSVNILYKKQNGICYFCGCQAHLKTANQKKMRARTASREHLIPKAQGGSNRQVNLRMSCFKCNQDRDTMHAIEWMRIVRNPKKLDAFYRARSLKKKLAKIRDGRKREARILKKHGMFLKTISLDIHTFNRVFA